MLAKEGPDEIGSKLAAALGSQGIFFVTPQILSRLYLFSLVGDDGQEEGRLYSVPQTSRTREYENMHDSFVVRSVARSKHVSYREQITLLSIACWCQWWLASLTLSYMCLYLAATSRGNTSKLYGFSAVNYSDSFAI